MEVRKLDRSKFKPEHKKRKPDSSASNSEAQQTDSSNKKKRKLSPKKKIVYLFLILVVLAEAAFYNYTNIKKKHIFPDAPPEIKITEISAFFYSICMDIIQQKQISGSYPVSIEDITDDKNFRYSTSTKGNTFLLIYDDGQTKLRFSSAADFNTVFVRGLIE